MISLVIIGRNEANNLERTFDSIKQNQFSEIIYVDCSSKDQSIQIAKESKLNLKIISLKSNFYSASLARYVGLKYVKSELVQFLDGDMTLNEDWIIQSSKFLIDNNKDAIVHGYKYVYKDPKHLDKYSILKDKSDYQSDYLQGSYMAKTNILKKSGYLDIRMICEEERDLYVRIRKLGYQVWYLNFLMSSHYDFKSRGLKYLFFSPTSVMILLPLFKSIKKLYLFEYLFVYRFLIPQLFIDIITIYSIIFLNNYLILISIILQLVSMIFYLKINRKGYWILWKSAILNIFRFWNLITKKVIYSHFQIDKNSHE